MSEAELQMNRIRKAELGGQAYKYVYNEMSYHSATLANNLSYEQTVLQTNCLENEFLQTRCHQN